MKKKGFTLVELLFVIVIVASISLSASIVFNEVTYNTSEEELKNIYVSIQRAARTYVDLSDGWTTSFNEKGFIYVSLSALQSANYVKENIVNPVTNQTFSVFLTVKVFVTPDLYVSGSNINQGRYVDTCIINDDMCIDSDGNELSTSECTTKCLN